MNEEEHEYLTQHLISIENLQHYEDKKWSKGNFYSIYIYIYDHKETLFVSYRELREINGKT